MNIGYYVHHHGSGHLTRALAIANHMARHVTLLGTNLAGKCGEVTYIELPDDRGPASLRIDGLPQALHYAPLHCDGIRKRAAALTTWIADRRPDLLVVDVSVEVAMLARLASTAVLYMRLAGARTDVAHLEAFRSAEALTAPFHEALDDPEIPLWIRQKTSYFPGLTFPAAILSPQPDTVLLLLGTGGNEIAGADISAAAAATPKLRWRVIGPAPAIPDPPGNLLCLGWVEDVAAEVAGAQTVIGTAGDGVVSCVLAAGRPFICLPQARPYDEQLSKARRLAAIGAALTIERWPAGSQWPELIAKAHTLSPAPHLHDPTGLQRWAAFITDFANL